MARWTEEEIAILRDCHSDMTNEDVAIKLNRTPQSIQQKAFALRLSKSTKHLASIRHARAVTSIDGIKTCNICHACKSIDDFHKRKDSPDGYWRSCKSCDRERYNKYYKDNSLNINARKRLYFAENPGLKAKKNRESRMRSPDRQVLDLKDAYIADKLGMKVSECPTDLIELKRIQIKIQRLIKEKK